jgi:drug/metabolite transporter (DMT)-like permease
MWHWKGEQQANPVANCFRAVYVLNPVVAVALGIVIFSETLTNNILIGGFIVVVSVAIVVAVESAKKQTLPQVQ